MLISFLPSGEINTNVISDHKFYKDKKILVTGGTGLIGRPLVEKLYSLGANIKVVSLDKNTKLKNVKFIRKDLRDFNSCLQLTKNCEIVFHLAGVKGSPKMTQLQPASFFVPTLTFNTNMMEASRRNNVKHYLYTSSIGVYSPSSLFNEDDVWSTFPSPNDKFAGWAKRMGELQAESYSIEYNWKNISIVRPANVYGEYDNFNPNNAMVIPSLINRIVNGENPLRVWGNGSQVRDFIYSGDVADAMIKLVKTGYNQPVNIGSGKGVSIKKIVQILKKLNKNLKVTWDLSKPTGDKIRVMNTKRATSLGIKPKTPIEIGITRTFKWYLKNMNNSNHKYNSFEEIK